jgi:hypothetical protein
MKVFSNLVLMAIIGFLWFDDNARRNELLQAQTRATVAEQQLQQLTGQAPGVAASSAYPAAALPAQSTQPGPASQSPNWFQQRLNGVPTVLDPGGTTQDPGSHH